ncbi:MAG: OmpA family protein [Deltaproteobacteria bacterium]|nr:OmpA family protein [Deltaproteobacteria bacterium]
MARRSARSPSARALAVPLRLVAGLAAALGPATALAQAYSADIELVRPTFSTGSLPGVDSALFDEPGTVRGGFMLQYEQNPLLVYADNALVGSAIKNRAMLHGGVSWDINRSVSLRASLPLAVQFDTDVGDIASDGGLVGDLFVGGKVKLYGSRPFSAALRADVGIPSGSKEIWMGENSFRGVFGPTFTSRVGPFDILADVNVMGRRPVETTLDLVLDSELWTSGGVRYHIWRNRASASAVLIQKQGLSFIGDGGAETSTEALGAFQYKPTPNLQLDFGAGKGLNDGVGATDMRMFVGMTWIRYKPEPPPPEPPKIIEETPELPPEPPPEPEPEPEWKEDELARIKGEQIVIRDPIEFEFNTSNILPKSLPTLQYVADLLNENWHIGHLVIEGHASAEGSDAYNYSLSLERSRSIWEALIRGGVHPDRMSFRSMGETVPKTAGTDEAALAENRRVEFKIIKQYEGDERPPEYRGNVRLPWNGEAINVKAPVAPPAPEEKKKSDAKPKDTELEDFFEKAEESDGAGQGGRQ